MVSLRCASLCHVFCDRNNTLRRVGSFCSCCFEVLKETLVWSVLLLKSLLPPFVAHSAGSVVHTVLDRCHTVCWFVKPVLFSVNLTEIERQVNATSVVENHKTAGCVELQAVFSSQVVRLASIPEVSHFSTWATKQDGTLLIPASSCVQILGPNSRLPFSSSHQNRTNCAETVLKLPRRESRQFLHGSLKKK